jgi:hypothetical protein
VEGGVEGREGMQQDGGDAGAHCYGEPGWSEVLDEAAPGARGGWEEPSWEGSGVGILRVWSVVSVVVMSSRAWC